MPGDWSNICTSSQHATALHQIITGKMIDHKCSAKHSKKAEWLHRKLTFHKLAHSRIDISNELEWDSWKTILITQRTQNIICVCLLLVAMVTDGWVEQLHWLKFLFTYFKYMDTIFETKNQIKLKEH